MENIIPEQGTCVTLEQCGKSLSFDHLVVTWFEPRRRSDIMASVL